MSIEQAVKSKYGAVAISGLSTDHAGVKAVAEAFGYTPEQLASIPAEANMGLSCGNPTAYAEFETRRNRCRFRLRRWARRVTCGVRKLAQWEKQSASI